MTTRPATHAGSWYTASASELASQLTSWLSTVPRSIDGAGALPLKGARVIIAPHAGYSYSGPAAAWAYASLDLSKTKRIFLLGPSHHAHLPRSTPLALSQHAFYATPFGNLPLDQTLISELHSTGAFSTLASSVDAAEHSLEMHLPYIYHLLTTKSPSLHPSQYPTLIPILVGSTTPADERRYGSLLAPYLKDESNIFIVSSDFCHWGSRFGYTWYLPNLQASLSGAKSDIIVPPGHSLSKRQPPTEDGPAIWESIEAMDRLAMSAIETGELDEFLRVVEQEEGNTICGRHPIGVVMAGLEILRNHQQDANTTNGTFKFVRYEQSSKCQGVRDSSVSYASAFAVL